MKLKFFTLLTLIVLVFSSCGSDKKKEAETTTPARKERAAPKTVEKKEPVKVVEEIASDLNDKGVGPIKNITLGDIDSALAEKGKEVFKAKCTACHKSKKKYIGPAISGVTERRSPEWIMNMILNPEVMIKENPTAMALLKEYSAPMANQNLNEEDARAVLEFFRTLN
jgi:mono/diheme cytochrome c family protein